MNKKALLEQVNSLLKAAKENPQQFKELTKAKVDQGKSPAQKQGVRSAREASNTDALAVKAQLRNLTDKHGFGDVSVAGVVKDKSPKPNLPKSEMAKTFDGMDLSSAEKKTVCPACNGKGECKSCGGQKSMKKDAPAEVQAVKPAIEKENAMDKNEMVKAAKALLAMAKNEPAKFEELTKAMAAPAPAPAAPKMPMAKPAAPKMPAAPGAPGAAPKMSMRMSKDEIKADLAKPWEPKHKKMGVC